MLVFGPANCTLLKALKNSARKASETDSCSGIRFDKRMSQVERARCSYIRQKPRGVAELKRGRRAEGGRIEIESAVSHLPPSRNAGRNSRNIGAHRDPGAE